MERRAQQRRAIDRRADSRREQLERRGERGRLTRSQQRELNRLQRREALQQRQHASEPRRHPRIDRDQAARGRFASQFHQRPDGAARRWVHAPVRDAWRRHHRARHVAWYGALYWPYVYSDVFYFTFWPYGYDAGYWAYAYDDFFDSIFFPYGAPYVDYAYQGPYRQAIAGSTTGSARGSDAIATAPGRVSEATREICTTPGQGVTAWPFERIEAAVQPTAEQEDLLEQLKQAAAYAAERLKEACPENLPMTPAGRLQAMTTRLQATLDAVKIVRPPLTAFYESLTDEQKARFNEIGPDFARAAGTTKQRPPEMTCGGAKAGLSGLAVDRIENALKPTGDQDAVLKQLSEAMDSAVAKLETACPTAIAFTPVGRLEAMQQRLEAMIAAAEIVRPALEDLYAKLSDEQKAKLNRLGRETARRDR
jgi:hypothetical protein